MFVSRFLSHFMLDRKTFGKALQKHVTYSKSNHIFMINVTQRYKCLFLSQSTGTFFSCHATKPSSQIKSLCPLWPRSTCSRARSDPRLSEQIEFNGGEAGWAEGKVKRGLKKHSTCFSVQVPVRRTTALLVPRHDITSELPVPRLHALGWTETQENTRFNMREMSLCGVLSL